MLQLHTTWLLLYAVLPLVQLILLMTTPTWAWQTFKEYAPQGQQAYLGEPMNDNEREQFLKAATAIMKQDEQLALKSKHFLVGFDDGMVESITECAPPLEPEGTHITISYTKPVGLTGSAICYREGSNKSHAIENAGAFMKLVQAKLNRHGNNLFTTKIMEVYVHPDNQNFVEAMEKYALSAGMHGEGKPYAYEQIMHLGPYKHYYKYVVVEQKLEEVKTQLAQPLTPAKGDGEEE